MQMDFKVQLDESEFSTSRKWRQLARGAQCILGHTGSLNCLRTKYIIFSVKGHPKQKNEGSLARIAYEVASAAGARGSQQKEVTACNVPVFEVCSYCLRENTHFRASLVVSLLPSHSLDAFSPQQQGRQAEALEALHF